MRKPIVGHVEQTEALGTLQQAAIDAWDDYQQTGLHATIEEADAWLADLERGHSAEPPQSHT